MIQTGLIELSQVLEPFLSFITITCHYVEKIYNILSVWCHCLDHLLRKIYKSILLAPEWKYYLHDFQYNYINIIYKSLKKIIVSGSILCKQNLQPGSTGQDLAILQLLTLALDWAWGLNLSLSLGQDDITDVVHCHSHPESINFGEIIRKSESNWANQSNWLCNETMYDLLTPITQSHYYIQNMTLTILHNF